jgi:tetratricopeptide (TPR) repeat protein
MREGDILLSKSPDGFHLSKVLRITPCPDQSTAAHVLLYQPFSTRPSLDDVDSAKVFVLHAPIDHAAMQRDSEVLGNRPVSSDELIGYFEYLKQTNFKAYIEEKGLTAEDVISQARTAYDEGNRLCEEKNFERAIDAYSRAIEHFPSFYEAHDNRAFALMDLARFREAAAGFEESLRMNPVNPVALFSLGECFLKLGEYQKAVNIFKDCMSRWPNQAHHREFLQRAQALASGGAMKTKPWWRFW